jgi:hypothetical protein
LSGLPFIIIRPLIGLVPQNWADLQIPDSRSGLNWGTFAGCQMVVWLRRGETLLLPS